MKKGHGRFIHTPCFAEAVYGRVNAKDVVSYDYYTIFNLWKNASETLTKLNKVGKFEKTIKIKLNSYLV